MELILHVSAQLLVKGSGDPLDHKYNVLLMDDDPFTDDLLGSTRPDSQGMVHYQVNPNDFQTRDSFLEKLPDLFLVVQLGEEIIFRSPVANNADVIRSGTFNSEDGASIDMGTFLVEV
jgi:hypothetical protein